MTSTECTTGAGVRRGFGIVELVHATISENTAPVAGGVFNDNGTTTLHNTIIANSAAANCSASGTGPVFLSFGRNLASDTTCNLAGPGDLPGTDPQFDSGGLVDNGGPTPTHALSLTSPAIDAAGFSCPISTDQRGLPRPRGGGCDIGAFETKGTVVRVATDEPDADPGDGVCLSDSNTCSLRAAIEDVNAGVDPRTIAFNIPGPGPHTIMPATPLPTIVAPVTIDGYTQPGSSPNTLSNGNDAVL